MNDVKNPSVPAEFDMTGCRFHFTADNICQCQLTGLMVEAVYLDMIHAKICCTQIVIVSRHLHTADVGTEISLCNTAQSTMENLIRNLSDTAVLLQTQRCDLAVMPACHEQETIFIICGKIAAAHAINARHVDRF